jgi:hypothetical protein
MASAQSVTVFQSLRIHQVSPRWVRRCRIPPAADTTLVKAYFGPNLLRLATHHVTSISLEKVPT